MESIQPQLDSLTASIDDLESALAPIINTALSASTSKLPLLDKAKLYVLATYALESILFSFIRLNGVNAKAHPVFQELNRVKDYFQKIKKAEDIGAGGQSAGVGRLDKEAAGRFIRAGLAGNEQYDREREEKRQRERAGAKRKLEEMNKVGTHTRFDGAAKRIRASEGENVTVVKASELDSGEEDEGNSGTDGTPQESLDQIEQKARNRDMQKRNKTPLAGKAWTQAVNAMQAEDPESVLSGAAKPDVVDESQSSRNKKKKKKKA